MPMPISTNGNLMPTEPAMSASAMTDTKLKGTNHSARPRKQAANNPTATIARIRSMPLSSTGGTHIISVHTPKFTARAGRNASKVIQLINNYKRLLLDAQPVDGDDANNKSIVVVFTDLPAAQAKDFFNGVLQ